MKLKVVDDETFIVYLTDFLDPDILSQEESIRLFLKGLVLKLKRLLKENFHGYYQLQAYVATPVMILEFYQIDEYTESVDLNMVIHLESDIYFRFEDGELISGNKYYDHQFFYVPVKRISDFIRMIEFGDFIYGEEVSQMKRKALLVGR